MTPAQPDDPSHPTGQHPYALLTPDQAAVAILKGWARGAFEIHFPRRFTLWLKGLRLLGYGPYFAAVRRSTGL